MKIIFIRYHGTSRREWLRVCFGPPRSTPEQEVMEMQSKTHLQTYSISIQGVY